MNPSSPFFWDSRRNRLPGTKGRWCIGEGVQCQGYSLLEDLVGSTGFFQVLMLHVTNRLPEKRLTQWLEAAFICLSFPDPRIWCNQVAALAGTARCSPVAAMSAGALASDSALYGPGSALAALSFIKKALADSAATRDLNALLDSGPYRRGKLRAPGYSRPVALGDDRVARMDQFAAELGFDDGPHLSLAWQLDKAVQARSGDSINLLGYIAAFWLDQGFNEQQAYTVFSLCVNGGLHACYDEAHSSPLGAFLPLRCDDVLYAGVAERDLPALCRTDQ